MATGSRSPRIAREIETIRAMVEIYCRDLHGSAEPPCDHCQALLQYAERRLDVCPFGAGKPACNLCVVHCYSPARREEVRNVMRHAGPRMLYRRPWLALRHWLDTFRRVPSLPGKSSRRART
jgi:hypothetical protein